MYWQGQVSRLKSFSNRQLNDLLKHQQEFAEKYPDHKFSDFDNYIEHVKLEIAERVGKQKQRN